MKRLLCLYKPAIDKSYPWILKHPKVKASLAHFKTRQDAMNWFLSLGYDCATWFQTEEKVFGGILISEKNAKGDLECELNVEKFDGNVDHNGVLDEFFFDHETGLRRNKEASKYVSHVKDFKEISDHVTYFPQDDEFVIERKKSSKDLEIEKLQRQIQELEALLSSKNVSSEEVQLLLVRLRDASSDKEQLQKEIEELKKRAKETPVKVVEQKQPTRIVEKEIVEVIKYVDRNQKEVVKFAYIYDLPVRKQLEALAVYSSKVELFASQINERKVTSVDDLNKIKTELTYALEVAKKLEVDFKNDVENKKLLKLVMRSLAKSVEKLSEFVVAKKEIASTPETFVYVKRSCGQPGRLAQELSFVLFDRKHIAFVKEKNYEYAIFAKEAMDQDYFLVFDNEVRTNTVMAQTSEQTEVVSTENPYLWWVILLTAISVAILLVLVLLLWLGVVPPLY